MAPPLGLSLEPRGGVRRGLLRSPALFLSLEKDREGGPATSRFPRGFRLRSLAAPRPRSMAVKKIAIFGATGKTGLTTLAQAVQAGMNWDGGRCHGVHRRSTRKGHRGLGLRSVGAVSALVCEDPGTKQVALGVEVGDAMRSSFM